jgi:hypothetical protein
MGSQISNNHDGSAISSNADENEPKKKKGGKRVFSLFSHSDSECMPQDVDEISQPKAKKKRKKPKKSNFVNYCFQWNFGGENIYLVGSFTDWRDQILMDKNGDESTKVLKLEKKEYYYKFIVDGDWRFAPDQKTVADSSCNINNFIDLTDLDDHQDNEEEEEEEETEEEEEEEEEVKLKDEIDGNCIEINGYNQEIPKFAQFAHEPPTMPYNLSKSVLDESINKIQLQNPEYSREFIKAQKDTKVEPIFQDRNLRVPTHISLSHAFFYPDTICINTNVCAMTQSILKKKYVTTVHYTPAS